MIKNSSKFCPQSVFMYFVWTYLYVYIYIYIWKGIPRQAEVVLGVPGNLRPPIILTFGTTRVVCRQPYAPAAFTPEEIPGTHFQRLSRPQGSWFFFGRNHGKNPGTVRLVAQRLNNYPTPYIYIYIYIYIYTLVNLHKKENNTQFVFHISVFTINSQSVQQVPYVRISSGTTFIISWGRMLLNNKPVRIKMTTHFNFKILIMQ